MGAIEFASRVPRHKRHALERLLFFNGCQERVARDIVDVIDRYGPPEIYDDGEGLIVYEEPAMATSGTGTRGTFDVTATFDVPREGIGAVIVFEESARDGSRINLVEVPVSIAR